MYIYGRIKRFTETVKSVLLNIDIGTWALCATTDTGSYDLIALHYPEDSESEGCFIRVVADELGYDTVFDDAKIYNETDNLETVLRAFALDINNYEYDERFKKTAVADDLGLIQDPAMTKMMDSVLGKDGTFDKYVDNKRKEQLERGDIIMADTLGKAAEERSTKYEEFHKKDDEESVES